jgi:hypothetical protein
MKYLQGGAAIVSRDAFKCPQCGLYDLCQDSFARYQAALQREAKERAAVRDAADEALRARVRRALEGAEHVCLHEDLPCPLCDGQVFQAPPQAAVAWTRRDVSELFHVTHWQNGATIAKLGLLSRRAMRRVELPHIDISLEGPQELRARKRLGNKNVHDFAPVFFAPLNGMTSLLRDRSDELMLLSIDPSVMLAPGVFTCDGNIAASATQAWPNCAGLDHVDWTTLRGRWNNFEDGKRISQAEALIPHQVPPAYIRRAYVRTPHRQAILARSASFNVQVRPDLFFAPG